ncbi:class I SAM-dependent methyltransferase [Brevundimonas sp. R86498]|uniref:class I SAM-dependent methyltransferase n=1 Tax=Brevundimonas sp. R86498 TaxID=3093845 RepID=UPI0037CAE069
MEAPINDNYVSGAPSDQLAIDLFRTSWISQIPRPGLEAGTVPLFEDARIDWLVQHRGGFDGQSVLELGPLEGGHTYMLEKAGAASILGIEANTLAYMKCLIAKEIMGTRNSRFLLGDFDDYLDQTTERFDFLLASGVLYHMVDPIRTLTNMARVTDEMFIWSHFFDDRAMPEGDPRRALFTGETIVRERDGKSLTYRLRGYGDSTVYSSFIGGISPGSVWLEKGETIAFLESHGFAVTPSFEHDDHPHGPAACLYARR